MRAVASLLGLAKSTLGRALPKAIKKRAQLTAGEKSIFWSRALKRKGYSKITATGYMTQPWDPVRTIKKLWTPLGSPSV